MIGRRGLRADLPAFRPVGFARKTQGCQSDPNDRQVDGTIGGGEVVVPGRLCSSDRSEILGRVARQHREVLSQPGVGLSATQTRQEFCFAQPAPALGYQVDLDGVYQYLGNPSMTGLGTLPVTFTPGASRETSSSW